MKDSTCIGLGVGLASFGLSQLVGLYGIPLVFGAALVLVGLVGMART